MRFLLISAAILLFEHDYKNNASHFAWLMQFLQDLTARYFHGLFFSMVLISLPVVISVLLDWRIVWRMFFAKRKGNEVQWEWYVTINWISSSIFTLSLTHLLSYGELRNLQQLLSLASSADGRFALILAFLSLSYLVAFFGVSLIAHDVSLTSSRPLKSANREITAFVPPAYYLGVVAVVWQLDTSLQVRALVAAVTMIFFAALRLSRRAKLASSQPPPTPKNTPFASVPVTETFKSDAMYTCKLNPPDIVWMHYRKQLLYDIFVYCLPVIGVSIIFPVLQPFAHLLSVYLTLFMPIYNFITRRIYLQPSPPQDPQVAKSRLESYPCDFMNGWYRLADSDELVPGTVKYVPVLGRHFALFRGQDNQVRCLDAHCIHLGANMAIRGKVVNNCLQCPFHAWSFDGEGKCRDIPYQQNIPAQAKTRAYHVCEYYGMILVWYHEKDIAPTYHPPTHSKLDAGDWVPRGHLETIVNMHLNEFAENSTDFAHFDPLHGKMTLPFTQIVIPGVTVNHRPGWKEGKGEESHMSWFLDGADLSLFGIHMPETAADAVITFVGPAGLVYFSFETPIGSIILFQTHTPIDPLRLKTSFRWYADAAMPRVLVWYIVGNWIAQWQNDIFVWENKKFANRPVLVKGDGPMNKQRRWLKQFYPSTARNTEIGSHQELCANGNSVGAACSGASTDVQW